MKDIYLTTAISYLNGKPHMGHKLEIVVSDIVSRYWKQLGYNVLLQTGTDEHGKKIEDKAKEMELQPIELCNKNLESFLELYELLGVKYDNFIRTSSTEHYRTVQHVFHILKEQGDIYLGKYEGWYSTREEKFITDLQAEQCDYKDEVTKKPLERIEEESYFFKMSKYYPMILKFYQEHPNFISDTQYYNQIMKRLEEPLIDLSISRTHLKWGIPLDKEHICYVWFDALLNYLTGIDYFKLNTLGNNKYLFNPDIWKNTYHIIGKDIVWFHGVIWLAMLMALNIKPPQQLIVHGFITDENGIKMSKSLGNVIDPFELLKLFPADTLRFYSVRYNNLEYDTKCNIDRIVKFHNNELGNNIGNLVNRITNLIHSCCNSVIPKIDISETYLQLLDVSFLPELYQLYKTYSTRDVSELILGKFQELNIWLTEKEPWKIKDNIDRRNQILRLAIERLYQLSHLLIPFMPNISSKIEELLNQNYMTLSELEKYNKKLNINFDEICIPKQKIILFPKIILGKE